ncbi:DUF1292 domain-containing protein [Acidaminobacter sp. JC074]|uniref:DUF1292 domain-containing protein n=1 Tax=Acidaminobacter sp. JC074 TaxID=2530199 RepID=UPI001F0E1D3A|nr:DUF1292 domain-containing protein [Acidaminobacter sp. JC074]MCH4888785.1 DUF1292 domain-containing protein [Acidaminobacter sp. JC074]
MDENIIVLLDENGDEIAFEIIADFEVNDQEYAILTPVDEDDDSALIFKVVDQGDDEPVLEYLSDEDEFDFVAKAYEELMDEED